MTASSYEVSHVTFARLHCRAVVLKYSAGRSASKPDLHAGGRGLRRNALQRGQEVHSWRLGGPIDALVPGTPWQREFDDELDVFMPRKSQFARVCAEPQSRLRESDIG
jgi:hypothetical protein